MGTTVSKLVLVMVLLSPLAEVLGVEESVGEIWFKRRLPGVGASTFKDGV